MARLGRFSDNELEFIRDVLDEHGDDLIQLLSDDIADKDLLLSGDLQSSLESKVIMRGSNPVLQLSFKSYGRAIEINWHRSKNTNAFLGVTQNEISSNRQNSLRKNKKKNTLWYSRNVYGSLNRLIGILMYEYQDYILAREKAKLQLINQNKAI